MLDPIGGQSVAEGGSLTLLLSANDDDGNALSFGHDGLPGFMSLTDNGNGTASLSIAPNFDDSGIHTITIRVTDDGVPPLSAEETFDVIVDNVNRAPQINTINNVTITEGDTLTVPVSGGDPDGDGVDFSSPDLPAVAILNNLAGNNAEIVISLTNVDIGNFTVTIDATDDAPLPLVSTTTFDINVQALETRVTTGLLAYYPFTEGSGTVVSDQSASGPPLDLDISVTWLSGSNGVSFSGGRVGTNMAASKIINALITSGASSKSGRYLPMRHKLVRYVWSQSAPTMQPRTLYLGRTARTIRCVCCTLRKTVRLDHACRSPTVSRLRCNTWYILMTVAWSACTSMASSNQLRLH